MHPIQLLAACLAARKAAREFRAADVARSPPVRRAPSPERNLPSAGGVRAWLLNFMRASSTPD